MIIIFLIIHIILCILVYLLMRISLLKAPRQFMPIVCLVPLWGLLALLFLEIRTRGRQDIYEEVGIEKAYQEAKETMGIKLEFDSININKEFGFGESED